jgi:hypothetical protein
MNGHGVVWTEDQRRMLGIGLKDCGSNDGWLRHRRRNERPCGDCLRARAACTSGKCGSYAGWMIHRRERTPPCRRCRRALNDYQRMLRWRKAMEDSRAARRTVVDHLVRAYLDAGLDPGTAARRASLLVDLVEQGARKHPPLSPEHASYCGPARGFLLCYCRCPKCRDKDTGRCTCNGCGAPHPERGDESHVRT